MANELKHVDVGTQLSKVEWEATTTHVADSQATGDELYFDGTNWKRRPIAATTLPGSGLDGQTFVDTDLPGFYVWIT
jgi:hypothetical protein